MYFFLDLVQNVTAYGFFPLDAIFVKFFHVIISGYSLSVGTVTALREDSVPIWFVFVLELRETELFLST